MPKINQLPSASSATAADLFAIENSSGTATKKVTGQQIKDFVTADVNAEVTDLKNAIVKNQVIIDSYTPNSYIDRNGVLQTNNNWYASDYIDVSQYSELIATMPNLRSTYNAFYSAKNESSFIRAFYIETSETRILVPENAAYMRISGRSDAFLATTIYFISKNTATVKALKDAKQARIPVYVSDLTVSSTTKNGVNYSFSNGKGTFSGTPSSTFTINIDGSTSTIPQWLNAGETYYVTLEKTGSDKVYFNIQTYKANSVWYSEPLKLARGSQGFSIDSFTIDSSTEIKGVLLRYSVTSAGGGSVDGTTVKLSIYKAPKQEKHLRVMQSNLGKFRYGYASLDTYGLTEAQYQTKLASYKKMYGKYRPDVLCVQEMAQYMDKAQTHDAFKVLYNDLFYNSSFGGTATSYGIFAQIDGPKFKYDSDSVVTEICEAVMGDSVVAIVSTALNSESGQEATRVSQLQTVMNRVANYEYAIICADLNIYSDAEMTSLIETAQAAGYTAANFDYWGRQDTYVPHPGQSYFNKIDNILVRGNIKIANFEVLTDETPLNPSDYFNDNKLASDHVPIIADLVIF